MDKIELDKNHNQNSLFKIAMASFVGTTVEFYDFYIFGIATALFFNKLFFSTENIAIATMISFLVFGTAFIARPIGAILFGHYGDKLGRKTTLIGSLLIMGISTTLVGILPTYAQIGIIAPIILCILRFIQGIGLGGEWGGAALLATENAPQNKRAIYAMFPQIGAPVGFIMASSIFILIGKTFSEESLFSFGWRIPFLISIVLIFFGLYMRFSIIESPVFRKFANEKKLVKLPIKELFIYNYKEVILGSIAVVSCFILFFLVTVFALYYSTSHHSWLNQPLFTREEFLFMQMVSIIFMAIASPISAYFAERFGRKKVLIISGIFTLIISLFWGYVFTSGNYLVVFLYLILSLFFMGMIYTPLAAFLPEIFPTKVRYTGASITFSIGSILGGSLTPSIASLLTANNNQYSIYYVGAYFTFGVLISIFAIFYLKETKYISLSNN